MNALLLHWASTYPAHTQRSMCWNVMRVYWQFQKYIHQCNFRWYSLNWCLLQLSAASPWNDHLQEKKRENNHRQQSIRKHLCGDSSYRKAFNNTVLISSWEEFLEFHMQQFLRKGKMRTNAPSIKNSDLITTCALSSLLRPAWSVTCAFFIKLH